MTHIDKLKRITELTREKRSIENWAKRRGGEFHYTFDEKAKLRVINQKIDRILEVLPVEKEIIPEKLF